MELQNLLTWRYATKAMNGQKVDTDKVEKILEAIRFAPSSNGLQPYELIVITNPEWKEKIKLVAPGQGVIANTSHLVVFAAWDNITAERINLVFNQIADERGIYEGLEEYRDFLIRSHASKSIEENFNHAARQAYIGLGFGLLAAAYEQVDSTPMEGFDPAALDEILKLPERGLRSVSILALGYRDAEEDWLVNMKKVRRPKSLFTTELK